LKLEPDLDSELEKLCEHEVRLWYEDRLKERATVNDLGTYNIISTYYVFINPSSCILPLYNTTLHIQFRLTLW